MNGNALYGVSEIYELYLHSIINKIILFGMSNTFMYFYALS